MIKITGKWTELEKEKIILNDITHIQNDKYIMYPVISGC